MTAICDNNKKCMNRVQAISNMGLIHAALLLTKKMVFFVSAVLIFLNFSSPGLADMKVPLIVKETMGINRNEEMIHNGIPLAKSEGIKTTANLLIQDSQEKPVPATFEVLSRWAGGKDDSGKEIQWLLVSFPATVAANTTSHYSLRAGTPVNPSAKVIVTDNPDDYTIDTGSAKFVISRKNMTLFDSVSLSSGDSVILENNGGSSSKIKGQSSASTNAPVVTIERMNDHYVCIKAEGDYTNTPTGSVSPKPLSYKIRYEFFAGSPTVVVYHKFYWAGQEGNLSYGTPITVDNVSLTLPDMPAYSSTDIYADAQTFFTGALGASQTASVKQKLRTVFANPHVATISHGTNSETTTFASQPLLINRSVNGVIAVSVDHMKYFEPQSIETDHNGKIVVNVMAQNQAFSNYQGTWARVGISAMESEKTYEDIVAENLAPLNNRLFAFPDNEYVRNSKIFLDLPLAGASDQTLQIYYSQLKAITAATKIWLEKERYHGLMTWGSLTRYASLTGFNETGTGTGWDKVYSGSLHTDYHNAWNNVVFQYLLEGNPSNLYDLSFMGARRMLHTQIIQPDNEGSISQMGWGYCGYLRYRTDKRCRKYAQRSGYGRSQLGKLCGQSCFTICCCF